jgi:competence protein ComEC
MPIVVLTIAWMAGVWLASLMDWPLAVWLVTAVLALLAAFLTRRLGTPALIFAALAALAFGAARYTTAVPTLDATHIAYYNDAPDPVGLIGLVADEPDVRDRYVNLRIAAERLTWPDGRSQPITGDVLVRAPRFPVIGYGTQVTVNGRLETPPEEPDFSYKEYLARQGVYSLIPQASSVSVLAENQGQPVLHAIYAFKDKAQATINRLIPNPEAALLSGILLGNDNGLPPALADDFRATGMTHIIAISGFNIALLIAIMMSLMDPFLPRKTAVLVAVMGIILYTILVGADASVVRAAIMGTLFLFTRRWLGRPNYAYASLFFAGFLMTLINPLTLWDVGFQLSFAATLGLMLYADPFSNWTRRQLNRRLERPLTNRLMGLLSEAVLLTLAAQVLTLPLMIGYFGQLSLISLAANALILPLQPGVMVWGGLATLGGMVWPALGQPFAWVAWLFLTLTIRLVRAFAAVPGAAVPLHVPVSGIIALYCLIAALTWWSRQSLEQRTAVSHFLRQNVGQRTAVAASLVALFLVGNWHMALPDGRLHVAFLDVGQGDAIFIQTPNGRQLLVDGGLYPTILNDALGRRLPFWDRHLDVVVATHPDADHVAGLAELSDRYRIERLITNGQGMGESAIYDALLRAAEGGGTAVHAAQAGEVIELDEGVRLEVLHPGSTLTDDRNENSVVLRLVYGDFSLLLTGDADEKTEEVLLSNGRPLSALVLKAGHHGANTSSSAPFLTAVRPQVVVISAGADNKYGHPHPDVLARAQAIGAVILRTDELGAIEVITDGRSVTWRASP